MLIHRDYRDTSGSLIKIYDDKITFYNPGALYGELTIKDLLTDNFTSKTRNKLIAKAFREIGKIERYGSGINRIINYCKEYGIIKPKFEEHADGFKVTIFKEKLNAAQTGWRSVISTAVLNGIPVPSMAAALTYYDGYRCERLPANLVQAQRDYFGAHTYERIDKPRGEFFHTNWTGRGGDTVSTTYNA